MVRLSFGCLLPVLLLAAIGIGVVQYLTRHQPDWPDPVPGLSLVPERPPLFELTEDNGVYHLEKLAERIAPNGEIPLKAVVKKGRENKIAFGAKRPEWDQLIDDHPELLRLFDRATDCPFWQAKSPKTFDEEVPAVQSMINLAKFNAYRLEQAASAERWDEMEEIFRRQLDASRKFTQGGYLIHCLVGIACESITFDAWTGVLAHSDPPPATLERIGGFVAASAAERVPMEEVFKFEWMWTSNAVDTVFEGELSDAGVKIPKGMKWLLNPERTRNNIHALWTHEVDGLQPFTKNPVTDSFIEGLDTGQPAMMFFADDPVGRILVAILLPATGKVVDDNRLSALRYEMIPVLHALERHQQSEGGYPETLEELVPGLLASVPKDPSSHGALPIRYQRQNDRFLLYALGSNQKDNGGVHRGNGRSSDESDFVIHPTKRMMENAAE